MVRAILRQLSSRRRQESAHLRIVSYPLPRRSQFSAQALQISVHVPQYCGW
jgi:hypothetical protein